MNTHEDSLASGYHFFYSLASFHKSDSSDLNKRLALIKYAKQPKEGSLSQLVFRDSKILLTSNMYRLFGIWFSFLYRLFGMWLSWLSSLHLINTYPIDQSNCLHYQFIIHAHSHSCIQWTKWLTHLFMHTRKSRWNPWRTWQNDKQSNMNRQVGCDTTWQNDSTDMRLMKRFVRVCMQHKRAGLAGLFFPFWLFLFCLCMLPFLFVVDSCIPES